MNFLTIKLTSAQQLVLAGLISAILPALVNYFSSQGQINGSFVSGSALGALIFVIVKACLSFIPTHVPEITQAVEDTVAPPTAHITIHTPGNVHITTDKAIVPAEHSATQATPEQATALVVAVPADMISHPVTTPESTTAPRLPAIQKAEQ